MSSIRYPKCNLLSFAHCYINGLDSQTRLSGKMSISTTSTTSRKAIKNPWFWCCFALSGVIVYFWELDILGCMGAAIVKYVLIPIDRHSVEHPAGRTVRDWGDEMAYEIVESGWRPTGNPLFDFIIGILHVILIIAVVVVLLVAAIVLLVLYIAFALALIIIRYLLKSSQSFRFLAYAGSAYLLSLFLYGVVFPLVWKAIAPILAFTVGEYYYQKCRRMLYGDKGIRLRQPLYLTVAVVMISTGIWRLATNNRASWLPE